MAIESQSSNGTLLLEVLSQSKVLTTTLSPSRSSVVITQHTRCCTLCIPVHSSRQKLTIPLEFRLPDGSLVHYPRSYFPAPLHTWINLLRFTGIPWKERWRLASWVEQLWEGDVELPADLEQRTADDWLASIGQSSQTRSLVWNPLARWLTGNALVTMSADAFVRSMKPVFLSTHPDSRISVVQDTLQTCFVQPIIESLKNGNTTILRNAEVTQLRYEQDRISGVLLQDGSLLQADWYVAAMPPHQLTPLLPERWLTRYAYFEQLAELRSIDCTILHLHAEQACATPRLILPSDTSFHSVLVTAPTSEPQTFRSSRPTVSSRRPNLTHVSISLSLTCSDHGDSSWLKVGLRRPIIERFPTPSSHSSLEPNYIDPFNAVRLPTYSSPEPGPIQAGLPTSKAPLSVATAAPMRSRFDSRLRKNSVFARMHRCDLAHDDGARVASRLLKKTTVLTCPPYLCQDTSSPGTRPVPSTAAASEEARRYIPHFVWAVRHARYLSGGQRM